MKNSFYAMLSRMKLINRWGLMRNTRNENLAEHCFDTACIAHSLALIKNKRFGGNIDVDKVLKVALYHDAPEIFTGDLPTPIKYFNTNIRNAYKEVEYASLERLLSYLPDDLRGEYDEIMNAKKIDEDVERIVKAADKLSALIKCIDESKQGNAEFIKAATVQEQSLRDMNMPEVDCFLKEFIPAFELTLDEQEAD